MSKNNKSQELLNEIRAFALEKIPAKISAGEIASETEYYRECRLPLNVMLTEFGAAVEFEQPKDANGRCKIKSTHSLPTNKQLAEACEIIDKYIIDTESDIIDSFVQLSKDEDDMAIPAAGNLESVVDVNIESIDKINNKKMINYVFGYDGQPAICKMLLDSTDLVKIAAIGEDLRKKRNRDRALIIGGIVLAVAGLTGAGIYLYNKNHESNDVPAVDVDEDVVDVDTDVDTNEDVVDIDVDEAPIVEIA